MAKFRAKRRQTKVSWQSAHGECSDRRPRRRECKLVCPECKKTSLILEECSQHRISFAHAVLRGACVYVHSFQSSKKAGSATENNLHLVYAMHQLDKGYSGAVMVKVMNIPPLPWHSAYQKISAKLCKVADCCV